MTRLTFFRLAIGVAISYMFIAVAVQNVKGSSGKMYKKQPDQIMPFALNKCPVDEFVVPKPKTFAFTDFANVSYPGEHYNKMTNYVPSSMGFAVETPGDSSDLWLTLDPDTTVCLQDEYFQVYGQAGSYSYIYWTHDGDGFFDVATVLNPEYFPGENDLLTGQVNFFMTVYSLPPENNYLVDTIHVTIVQAPQANAGENVSICEDEVLYLNGMAEHYSNLLWSSEGDGTFSNPYQLTPVYLPGEEDLFEGGATLCLVAYPDSPCNVADVDCIDVTISKNPVAIAGEGDVICGSDTLLLEGYAANYDSVYWSTTGDGYFEDMFATETTYFPGAEDVNNGQTHLILTATAESGCPEDAVDTLQLFIQQPPQVNLDPGTSLTLCAGDNLELTVSPVHYSSVAWEPYGDGQFDDPSSLNPVYTPGANDLLRGYFFLYVYANPISPCEAADAVFLAILLTNPPEIEAGTDTLVCGTEPAQLHASGSFLASVYWSSEGDGSFNNPLLFEPLYQPGTSDIDNGEVILNVEGLPYSPCEVTASDQVTLYLAPGPVVDAGPDAYGCGQIQLQGSVLYADSLQWSTTGDGSFDDPELLSAVYTPGDADLLGSSVGLILTAMPLLPCSISISDTVNFLMDHPTITNQPEDQTVYAGDMLEIIASQGSQSAGEWEWFFNGESIPGQSGNVLQISNVNPNHAGAYHCAFTNACSSISSDTAHINVYGQAAQEIQLPAGWSGISSFILPENTNLQQLFAPVLDRLISLSSDDGIFYPAGNLNTIGNWNSGTGYQVKMAEATTLTMNGWKRFPPEPIVIPTGWSMLPVTCSQPVEVAPLFAGYPAVIMIKEIAGTGTYWPAKGINSLHYLMPGRAYAIYSNATGELILTFPAN